MGKRKFYVVWKGLRPGIYDSWTEAKLQINEYPGARYKSFNSEEEAISAYSMGYEKHKQASPSSPEKTKKTSAPRSAIIKNSISVDAACSGNPGVMEYRGVKTFSKEQIFLMGPFKEATNNIGEFLAIIHAASLLKKKNREDITIYTDSRTAMAWVRNKKVKTTLKRSQANKPVWELIDRATVWITKNDIKNPIVKWETKSWGEIPADFGRK